MEEWKKSMRNVYSRKSEKDVINEVLKIKAVLDDDKSSISTHSWGLFNKLLPLEVMGLSSNVLRTTGIRSSVYRFRDHPFKRVKDLVCSILEQWGSDVVAADQKQILPTPKKNNRPVIRIFYKNVPVVNLDKENIIPGDSNIMRVTDQLDSGRTIQHTKSIKTNIIPNGPSVKIREGETNLKRKTLLNMINEKSSDGKSCSSSIEGKVEAAKRKLYEIYKETEDAKKKRTIQVIELHEIGKQRLLPKARGKIMKKPHSRLIKKMRSKALRRKTTLCY